MDDRTDLTREDYKTAVVAALKESKNDDVPTLASAAAFRLFLALFPALVAVVGVWSLVTDPAELTAAADRLSGILPREAAQFIRGRLEELASADGAGVVALVIGVTGALWAATGAAAGLMKALSTAYDVAETRKLPKMRLHASLLCVALLIALLALFALLIVGPQLEDALLGSAPPILDGLASVARYVLAIMVLVLLFAFTYYIGPNREHPSWEWMSPGAVVATIGWLVVSVGFSVYAQNLGNYEAYGTLAGPVVLMLWLQLTMTIVLVGAEINAEIMRRRAANAQGRTQIAGPAERLDGGDQTAEVPLRASASIPPPAELSRTIDLTDGASKPTARRAAGIAAGAIAGLLAVFFARRHRR